MIEFWWAIWAFWALTRYKARRNEPIPIRSTAEDLVYMQHLMKEGFRHQKELIEMGVRPCTIKNYWHKEVEKYPFEDIRRHVPAEEAERINKASLEKLNRDIELRKCRESVETYFYHRQNPAQT